MDDLLMNRLELEVMVEVGGLFGKSSFPTHSDGNSESAPSDPLDFDTLVAFNLKDDLVRMESLVKMNFY